MNFDYIKPTEDEIFKKPVKQVQPKKPVETQKKPAETQKKQQKKEEETSIYANLEDIMKEQQPKRKGK